MKSFVDIRGRRVAYVVRRSQRRTLEIAVHPDLRVEVTAPADTAEERIDALVRRRALWIERQLDRFEDLRPLPVPRRYVAGETHRYLGRQYRLRVVRGAAESVRLKDGFLRVTTASQASPQRVRALVDRWYAVRAHVVLAERLVECVARARQARLPLPSLIVRKMVRRWGSCTASGRVILNVELVKVPTSCIDYVIMHEICHLRAMHHGPEFWWLLGSVMPDWESRRRRLDRQEV